MSQWEAFVPELRRPEVPEGNDDYFQKLVARLETAQEGSPAPAA